MYRCLICRFQVQLDDAIAATRRGSCVCLRCYSRETHSELRLTDELRRAVEQAMAA